MEGARSLISVFHQLNRSDNRTVAHFTPSLIGMFGSLCIFDAFLAEIDAALATGQISASLKKRAANLSGTFIPQVAGYNGVDELVASSVTAADLRDISADSLEKRRKGVVLILSSLMSILSETVKNGEK